MGRVVFYTPGFLALLLLKAGEPTSFGITVELLMLTSASAVVAGLFIGTQSGDAGADHSSRVGTWCGSLVLELLPTVEWTSVAITVLRKVALASLVVTPLVRLTVAGALLGLRGEYRYVAYAVGVLTLLGLALGAGVSA